MAKKKSGSKKKKTYTQTIPNAVSGVAEIDEKEDTRVDDASATDYVADVTENGAAFIGDDEKITKIAEIKQSENNHVGEGDSYLFTEDATNKREPEADISEIESEADVYTVKNDDDMVKPSDISEIQSEDDTDGYKMEEDTKKPTDISEIESEIDISDAKTEVVDNTAIVEDDLSNPVDGSDHPDDEESNGNRGESGIMVASDEAEDYDVEQISAAVDTSSPYEDHPDDEPSAIIEDQLVSHENDSESKIERNLKDDSLISEENVDVLHVPLIEELPLNKIDDIQTSDILLKADNLTQRFENDNKDPIQKEEDISITLKIATSASSSTPENQNTVVEETSQTMPDDSVSDRPSFSLAELMIPQDGVDWAKREDYLHEDEFCRHFGMDKNSFSMLPKWKQQAAKKKLGIF